MAKRKVYGNELWQDETTGDLYRLNPDGTYSQVDTLGAARVVLYDSAGNEVTSLGGGDSSPDTLAQPIPFSALTGFVAYHFPAGSNITYLTVTVTGKVALATGIPANMALILYLDADSDAARDAICGATGDLPTGIAAPGVYQCPIGQTTTIPLQAALSGGTYGGGRIDARSLDGEVINALVTAG